MQTTTTLKANLIQSRNGGKVHAAGCSRRSRYAKNLNGTEGMTVAEAHTKFGNALCGHCFPQAPTTLTPKAKAKATPAPAKAPAATCAGTGTTDWATGTGLPEFWGYKAGNGGTCGHCGKDANTASNDNPEIGKHKA